MNPANYVIFHPDRKREEREVTATTLVNGILKKNWVGNIWVDKILDGNEDPFVFADGWLYSYCHASQLRRKVSTKQSYLQEGSWVIFCSGDKANDGVLCVDTVFEVGVAHPWKKRPLELPQAFSSIREQNIDLWKRHFKFPFHCIHQGVTHTFEAKMGVNHSFLPLFEKKRVSIDFDDIPQIIRTKIENGVWGKYPVDLAEEDAKILVDLIRCNADTQVLQKIKLHVETRDDTNFIKPC